VNSRIEAFRVEIDNAKCPAKFFAGLFIFRDTNLSSRRTKLHDHDTAPAHFTFHSKIPIHAIHQRLGNGESQPKAGDGGHLVAAIETVEDMFELFRGYALAKIPSSLALLQPRITTC